MLQLLGTHENLDLFLLERKNKPAEEKKMHNQSLDLSSSSLSFAFPLSPDNQIGSWIRNWWTVLPALVSGPFSLALAALG